MRPPFPYFLQAAGTYKAYHLLYDFVSFVLFLVFVLLCFILGKPLYYVDKCLKTNTLDYLIHFFEFFAR